MFVLFSWHQPHCQLLLHQPPRDCWPCLHHLALHVFKISAVDVDFVLLATTVEASGTWFRPEGNNTCPSNFNPHCFGIENLRTEGFRIPYVPSTYLFALLLSSALPNISIGRYICFCESHVFVSLPILFHCPVGQGTFEATVVRKVANVVC